MDIVWCALIGAFFLLTVALVVGCERLMPLVLLAAVKPLGLYTAKLMEAPRWQPLARFENGVLRLCGIKDEMNWRQLR